MYDKKKTEWFANRILAQRFFYKFSNQATWDCLKPLRDYLNLQTKSNFLSNKTK